jgi:hypothetical protein
MEGVVRTERQEKTWKIQDGNTGSEQEEATE